MDTGKRRFGLRMAQRWLLPRMYLLRMKAASATTGTFFCSGAQRTEDELVSVLTNDTLGRARFCPFGNRRPQERLGPATRERRKPWKRRQPPFPESLIPCEPTFQTQTLRLSRQRGADPGRSPLGRSHEPLPRLRPASLAYFISSSQFGRRCPGAWRKRVCNRIHAPEVIAILASLQHLYKLPNYYQIQAAL